MRDRIIFLNCGIWWCHDLDLACVRAQFAGAYIFSNSDKITCFVKIGKILFFNQSDGPRTVIKSRSSHLVRAHAPYINIYQKIHSVSYCYFPVCRGTFARVIKARVSYCALLMDICHDSPILVSYQFLGLAFLVKWNNWNRLINESVLFMVSSSCCARWN